jgi:hypothetical protein
VNKALHISMRSEHTDLLLLVDESGHDGRVDPELRVDGLEVATEITVDSERFGAVEIQFVCVGGLSKLHSKRLW